MLFESLIEIMSSAISRPYKIRKWNNSEDHKLRLPFGLQIPFDPRLFRPVSQSPDHLLLCQMSSVFWCNSFAKTLAYVVTWYLQERNALVG